jgi:hypothetical protein
MEHVEWLTDILELTIKWSCQKLAPVPYVALTLTGFSPLSQRLSTLH